MGNFDSQIEYKPIDEPPVKSSGTQKSDKITVGAGSHKWEVNVKDGMFIGGETFEDATFGVNFLGEMFASLILIKNEHGAILIDSNSSTGDYVHLLNSTLNTQTKDILGEFTFEDNGAIKIAADSNNGIWLSPTGILGKKSGSTTFALDVNGDLSMKGTLIAGSVIACNLDANLINAGTITGCTVVGGTIKTTTASRRIEMNNSNELNFYYDNDNDGRITSESDGDMRIWARNDLKLRTGDSPITRMRVEDTFLRAESTGYDLGADKDGKNGETESSGASTFVTSVFVADGEDLKYNWRKLTFTGGILTDIGDENTSTICTTCV